MKESNNQNRYKMSYISSQKIKDFFWKSKKGKIILVLSAIIVLLIVAQIFFRVPVSTAVQEPVYYFFGFTQELYAEGDGNSERDNSNFVVFPYSILFCCEDHKVETVFESILEDAGQLWVMIQTGDGEWWWWYTGWDPSFNNFETINPYQIYYVLVENDCTLQISCWD